MDKPVSNKVVTGLLVIVALIIFSPFFTGNGIDSGTEQEATVTAFARGQCPEGSATDNYEQCLRSGENKNTCYDNNCASAEELCGFWCRFVTWWSS